MHPVPSAHVLRRNAVCIDLETTGGHPSRHRIIEIGLVELDTDGGERTWSTLVNPGGRIPSTIESFTGITTAMVRDAPSFEDIHRELLERLDGRLFVAHNARFDYGFVRAELLRLGVRFRADVLCTVKLSRRLHPQHPRHNLDAVMARHGVTCADRHRALGDAVVLRDLLRIWADDVGATVFAAAVDAQVHDVALPTALPADLADDLPEAPGVYRFYGDADALLYVGKSKNLRQRVLDHFAAAHRSAAESRLSAQVRRVDWTETVGELGALLQEATAVKALQPQLNRRLRTRTSVTLQFQDSGDGHERLDVHSLEAEGLPDGIDCYGLYKDARSAWRAAEEIVRAHALCARVLGLEGGSGDGTVGASCFGRQIGRCRGACVGQESAALHNARARLAFAGTRIAAWPFRGAVAVIERDWRGIEDAHLLDAWCYLGTAREEAELARYGERSRHFDPDIYRILRRFFEDPGTARIVELPR